MKKFLLCICLLIIFKTGFAQQEFFYVTILSADTKQPIKDVYVNAYCDNKLNQFFTDSNGLVQIPIAYKNCIFSLDANGYDDKYNIHLLSKNNVIYIDRKNTMLQDIVVTGQAKKILAEKSIYKINIINATTLTQNAANNLGDALALQTNFFKQQDNILGSTINMQGIGGQNIKILINGIPVNGRENGNIDISQLNIANADRIEIIKGPMSVLYGTDALGGVINIITKQNTENKKLELQSYAESTYKINSNIFFSGSKKRHSISANIARNFFGGYLFADTFKRSQTWKPKDQYTFDGNYTYATSKGKFIYTPTLMFETIMNRGIPTVDAFGAYATDEYYKTKRIANTFIADYELDSTRKLTFSNNISIYSRIKNRYAKNLMTQTNELTTNRGDQDTSNFIDYNFRGFYNSNEKSKLAFMVGYEINVENAISNKIINRKKTIADFASYITLPINISPKLIIQPAVRVAENTFYKAPITPSLNIKYILSKNILLRASYAKGFRAPSLKELYLNFVDVNHNIQGNDSLKAEKSNQVQLHLDATIYTTTNFKIKIANSIYFNSIQNQIALALKDNATATYQYANVDNFKNLSNELNINTLYKKWKNNIGLTFNKIFSADSGKGYTNFEFLYITSYPIAFLKSNINFNYRYIGSQAILGIGTVGQNAMYNAYLPAMNLVDINIGKQFYKNKLQVQLGARNIFNVTSMPIQGNPNISIHGSNGQQLISPGRSYFINARWSIF